MNEFWCIVFGAAFYFGTVGDSIIAIIGGGATMAWATLRLLVSALKEAK